MANTRSTRRLLAAFLVSVIATVGGISTAAAQDQLTPLTIDGLTAGGAADRAEDVVAVKADLTVPEGDRPAMLVVTATIEPGYHIYSLSQGSGGPIPSRIKLDQSSDVRVAGEFVADPPAEEHAEEAFDGLMVESHEGRVMWAAPLEISAGVDLEGLSVKGSLRYQACTDQNCFPPTSIPFTARLTENKSIVEVAARLAKSDVAAAASKGVDGDKASLGSYQAPNSHVTIRGQLEAKTAQPGEKVKLVLTAVPAKGYHVYPLAEQHKSDISLPTRIGLVLPEGWNATAPVASSEPVDKPSPFDASKRETYHDREVSWTVPIEIPKDAAGGDYEIAGVIGYQTCFDKGCEPPLGANFNVTIPVGNNQVDGALPLVFRPAKYSDAEAVAASTGAKGGDDTANASGSFIVQGDSDVLKMSPWAALALGLLGGLILNLMPCVLPVIGLKVLAFVEQSGHDRGRVLLLNVVYSAGMMSIFIALASLAVFAKLGWGQLFQSSTFTIPLIAVVFAMGLSFLGVWEVPTPTFVGGRGASNLAAREGVGGAFFKGIISTLLATSCGAPFVAPALVWSAAQPPVLTYAVFAAIGLGMSLPYLLIGAFPHLLRFLPKPGAWMDTFKQLMGFVLLGTVVYLFTFLRFPLVVPTLALLFGIWAACWWINRTPLTAGLGPQLRAWAEGLVFAAAIGVVSFAWLDDVMVHRFDKAVTREFAARGGGQLGGVDTAIGSELPWRPFSRSTLDELTGSGKTVMVDFTADWCATCLTLGATVLNTEKTKEVVEANGVVPLLADWTEPSTEIDDMLSQLNSKQIPVLAIFPADRPNQPIVLRGWYTQDSLYNAIAEAGPSKTTEETASTAMRAQ